MYGTANFGPTQETMIRPAQRHHEQNREGPAPLIRLRERLASARICLSVRRRMELELERLAQIDDQGFDPDEAALIDRLVGGVPADVEAAPFDALWAHAQVFLSACLTVAVADGRYSVEQARHVSILANRLGWSAFQLSALEGQMLTALEEVGWSRMTVADWTD